MTTSTPSAAEPPPGEWTIERLESEICELAGHLWAAECRWLLMVDEFDRREGWGAWGLRSCAHWLSWRCGLSLGAAREKVRVARRLPELSLVTAAFANGELSYAKVRALTRAARPENEATLLDMARSATTPQLERIVSGYRRVRAREEIDEANDRQDRRSFNWIQQDDGSVSFSGRLGPDDAAVVIAAIEAAREGPAVPPSQSMEWHPHAANRADALVGVARAALAALGEHRVTPEPCLVVIHVDEDVLSGAAHDGLCQLEDGPGLAPETARRLACDASVVRITEQAAVVRRSSPLDVGRRTRSIPPALRRALRSRDGGCRFPGCSNRRFVDGHHVRHWAAGGETKLTNLLTMCRPHHRLVHEGGYTLRTHLPNEFTFTRPDGTLIPEAPAPTALRGPAVPDRNEQAGIRIDHDTCRSLDEGAPFDLNYAVEALL